MFYPSKVEQYTLILDVNESSLANIPIKVNKYIKIGFRRDHRTFKLKLSKHSWICDHNESIILLESNLVYR
jgi:hypothetical protein